MKMSNEKKIEKKRAMSPKKKNAPPKLRLKIKKKTPKVIKAIDWTAI